MIGELARSPEDPAIVVHAWDKRAPRKPVLGARFPRGGQIPAQYLQFRSRDWKIQRHAGRPRWKHLEIPDVRFGISGSVPADKLRAIGVYTELFVGMLEEATGRQLPQVNVEAFGDQRTFCAYAAMCGAANAMSFYDPRTQKVVVWSEPETDETEFQRLMAHELTHAYMDGVFGVTSPLWFAEGMAEFFGNFRWTGEGRIGGQAVPGQHDPRAIALLRLGGVPSIQSIMNLGRNVMYGATFQELYAQAWALVYFMQQKEPELIEVVWDGRIPRDELLELQPRFEAFVKEIVS